MTYARIVNVTEISSARGDECVNSDLRYAERLAKSVRQFVHPAIYRQIEEDSNGHKQW